MTRASALAGDCGLVRLRRDEERLGSTPIRAVLVQGGVCDAAARRVGAAGAVADRFGARVVGVGAAGDAWDLAQLALRAAPRQAAADGLEIELAQASHRFQETTRLVRAGASWRAAGSVDATTALIDAAHAADLIVHDLRAEGREEPLRADLPALLRRSGRPVLAGTCARPLRADVVIIAWKDGPSCRRAVQSAEPFLDRAKEIHVVAVQFGEDGGGCAERRLREVAAGLRLRGLSACSASLLREEPRAPVLQGGVIAAALLTLAREHGADLIVAGAYGRSAPVRLATGSHTDELIARSDVHLLLQA